MNKSRDNKSISFTVSDAVQMPVKKKSYKYMMLFKHKQRTPQLIERVKSEKEISKIHDIYRNCYERVINYDSRVANSMDLQIVKPLISIKMQGLQYFLSSL